MFTNILAQAIGRTIHHANSGSPPLRRTRGSKRKLAKSQFVNDPAENSQPRED